MATKEKKQTTKKTGIKPAEQSGAKQEPGNKTKALQEKHFKFDFINSYKPEHKYISENTVKIILNLFKEIKPNIEEINEAYARLVKSGTTDENKIYYTSIEYMNRYGVTKQGMYYQLKNKELKKVKIGKLAFFRKTDFTERSF